LTSTESLLSYLELSSRSLVRLSYTLNVADLYLKSHIIYTLSHSLGYTLDFVELCGSEQAVIPSSSINDDRVRDFVTRSFNSLSSTIVKQQSTQNLVR